MARRKSAPAVLPPLRNCAFCRGYGWVSEVVGPPAQTRVEDGQVKAIPAGRPLMRRCSCTDPQKRNQESAPEPAPAGLDGARKRSGEKEEA